MDQESSAGGPTHDQGPRSDVGFSLLDPVRSFVETIREVLFEPTNFFRRLPPRGSRILNPLVFALACTMISFPLRLLTAPFDPLALGFSSSSLTELSTGRGLAFLMILFPLFMVLCLYISAAILHVFVLIFVRPADTGFEATFLVGSYTSAWNLLAWIPVLGTLSILYGYYLIVVGIKEMHGTTTGRALTAVLVSTILFTTLLFAPFLLSPGVGA